MRGFWQIQRLLLRRFGLQLAAWILPLWTLVAATTPSYRSVYPSLDVRGELVEQMRRSPGTRILYGDLPRPGTLGQLMQWETGTYVIVCVSIMAIVMTATVTRRDEERGLVELLRGSGAGRRASFVGPTGFLACATGLLGLGTGLTLTVQSHGSAELTATGGWAFAGVVTTTAWGWIALTSLLAQLCRDSAATRGLAFLCLTVAFFLRTIATSADQDWLRWLSPLAWRDLVRPYTDDGFGALGLMLLLCAATMAVAAWLEARREHGSGYLPDRSRNARRWKIRGHDDLLARLRSRSLAGWAVAVVFVAALFAAMSSGVTELISDGGPTADMLATLSGGGSPVWMFFSHMTMFVVLLVLICAVQRVLGLVTDERDGLVELEAAAGVSRRRMILSRAASAAVEAAFVLGLAGAVLALITATQITRDHAVARAAVLTASQYADVLAAIGMAIALVGLLPRMAGLTWAVVAWSAFAQIFGGLVELPEWAKDASLLGHQVDVVGSPDAVPHLVLVAIAAVGTAIGTWGYGRRDIPHA